MAKNKQTRKFRIATLLLSVMMAVAACSLVLTACGEQISDKEDSKPSIDKRTDTQTFANGNFEYFNDSDGSYLIGSPESWSGSAGINSNGVSANSSVAKSGIVNTSSDWSTFADAYKTYTQYKDADKEAERPDPFYKDIDNQYDIPGWDLAKKDSLDADPKDEAVKEEAKKLNPGTPFVAKETEDKENGTNILMLHSYRSDKMGTAMRYTSSSVTLPAGTAAKVSVWVKTAEMSYNDGSQVSGNRGAYIKINNTVAGKEQDALVVRNIDTKDVTANNGWEQYTFYLKASVFGNTTFTVELGLGMQAEGKSSNWLEYVQGYAFFDNLEYSVMKADKFDTDVAGIPADQRASLTLGFDNDLKKIDAATVTDNRFSLNLDNSNGLQAMAFNNVAVDLTKDDRGNTVESYFPNGNRLTANRSDDINRSGIKKVSDITAANGYSAAAVDAFKNFGTLPFSANDSVLMLYSSKGAPYTATLSNDNTTGAPFTLAANKFMVVSFWIKTSDLQGGTGVSVALKDETVAKGTVSAVDTTTLAKVDLTDDTIKALNKEDRKAFEDINDGWKQCFFFVNNTSEDAKTFTLEVAYGPKEVTGTKISSYQEGFAALANVSFREMTADEFAVKSTDSYAVEVTFSKDAASTNNNFDEIAYTDADKIKTDVANLRNYSGVYGGSTYVGGTVLEGDKNTVNANKNAGLLNKEYADKYAASSNEWKTILGFDSADKWDAVFGNDCTQPLLIANSAKQSYGFVANNSSVLAANAFTQVTMRVKLSAGATATIYLIEDENSDFGEKKYTNNLAFNSGVSYRYDNEGNVINKDPSDNFNAKTNTLFYLQSNGLWAAEKHYNGDVFFANLANYAKDEDGNLIDSKENIVYYVSDDEQEQADGIYYRYKNENGEKEVKVQDFTKSDKNLDGAVLQNAANKTLAKTIKNDSASTSDWIYVRFFLASGIESKNYRTEVWSGTRDGKTENDANSFVIFDKVTFTALTKDTFDSLINENLDEFAAELDKKDAAALKEDYKKSPAEYIDREDGQSLVYFNYSLFDDNDYKPFDDSRTTKSNPYADYKPANEDKVAYFNYNYEFAGHKYHDTYVNFAAYENEVKEATDEVKPEDDEKTESVHDQNVWLLAASILLAAALIFTLVALLIKNLLASVRKKEVKNKPAYDNKRNRYIRKLKLEESEHEENDEEDVLPEEGEISEEEIYQVEDNTAEASEETSEENKEDSDKNND